MSETTIMNSPICLAGVQVLFTGLIYQPSSARLASALNKSLDHAMEHFPFLHQGMAPRVFEDLQPGARNVLYYLLRHGDIRDEVMPPTLTSVGMVILLAACLQRSISKREIPAALLMGPGARVELPERDKIIILIIVS
jgi:hypothetical protein